MTSSIISKQFKCKEIFGLTLVSVLASTILFGFGESFAQENEQGVVWELLFIKKDLCTPIDNLAQVYSELTAKYFALYELENTQLNTKCISESEYKSFEMNNDTNLLIIIYDKDLGTEILQPNNLDGIYAHSGNNRADNHLVILCHCSNYDSGYESTLPSWILSHELSHFVLSYKGYSQHAIEQRIHEIESEYDNCVGTNFENGICDEFKVRIRPDNFAQDYIMMKPYSPAVGNKLIKYVPNENSNPEIIDLQRELAKMWIKNMIDDSAYANTLRHLVDSPTQEKLEIYEPLIDIPNGFVIAEVSKPKDVDWKEYLNPSISGEEKLQPLLDYIPFNLEDAQEESQLEKMPNWFKTRALLWSEKRISDKVFFDGVEHLVRMGIIQLN